MLSFWRQRFPWYPDHCFGPYRPLASGYSRRELAADGIVHVLGLALSLIGIGALMTLVLIHDPPSEIVLSLGVYSFSLITMLLCSACFNGLAWSKHLWRLQLADHAGILILIAGTYCARADSHVGPNLIMPEHSHACAEQTPCSVQISFSKLR